MVPRKLFLLLDPAQNLIGDAFELSQRGHARPHLLAYHFAASERDLCRLRPPSFQEDLKKSSHDSACRLSDENHISVQGVAVQFELAYVGLQKYVDFGDRVVWTPLDGQRYLVEQFLEFLLLFVSDGDILELRGQGEQLQNFDETHIRLNLFIVDRDRTVFDVIVTGYFAQSGGLEGAVLLVVFNQVVLIQLKGRAVHQVHSSLHKMRVVFDAAKVGLGRLAHADVVVGVSQPVDGVPDIVHRALHDLCVQLVRKLTCELTLYRQLLV